MISVSILAILTAFNVLSDGARILGIFQTPSLSHQVVFRPLMLELSRRGHEITIMTTDPIFTKGNSPKNYTEIDVHDISYACWTELVAELQLYRDDPAELLRSVYIRIHEVSKMQLEVEDMKKIANGDEKFDLLIFEHSFREVFDISRKLKIPTIEFSSLTAHTYMYKIFGIPTHPLLYPNFLRKRTINLTLWEKLKEIKNDLLVRYTQEYKITNSDKNNGNVAVFNTDYEVDLLFVNCHPIWDHNRPVPPNVVYLGGLHMNPEKDLPTDLKAYLDFSKNGVIYMSFGTNVDPTLLPEEKIQVFCNVFSKLPFDVLWKWNGDKLHCQPDNVKISKWLPQSDLLRHPNIKVFITQAGLQSTDESITAGVPLIAFPMLGDQWYNAEKYVQYNIGVKMDFGGVTEESLENAIKTVIEDKSYRENIIKLKAIINDQPQTSLERAVWWTEYVLRHGGAKHLRSPMANISWAEYFMLDVVAVVFGTLAAAAGLLLYISKKISKIFFSNSKLKKS